MASPPKATKPPARPRRRAADPASSPEAPVPRKVVPDGPAQVAAAAAPPEPATLTAPDTVAAPKPQKVAKKAVILKKKALIEKVSRAIGGRTKGVRDVVEATLAIMGEALKNGEVLNLPPLGKARVARAASDDTNGAMTIRLRQGAKPKGGKQGLAADGD